MFGPQTRCFCTILPAPQLCLPNEGAPISILNIWRHFVNCRFIITVLIICLLNNQRYFAVILFWFLASFQGKSQLKNILILLACTWFTVLCSFQVHSTMIQFHIYMHPLFFRWLFHTGYCGVLSRGPWAVQEVLLAIILHTVVCVCSSQAPGLGLPMFPLR